jgi:glycosyltransferase involved in cell wall biosynthesis
VPTVLQVVLTLSPGGTERLTVDLVRRLSGLFRMAVCCLDYPGEWADGLTASGIRVVALGRGPGFQPSLGLRIARLAAELDASVLHCHHYSPFVYGALASLVRPRLRVIYTEHGRLSDDKPRLKRRIANRLLGRVPGPMFAVSAALRDHMLAEGLPERVGVIHNGIDVGPPPGDVERHRARQLLGVDNAALVIGTAARLDAVKNLPALVAALAQVRARHEAAQLIVVGDGSERQAIEDAAWQHGVSSAVRILGHREDVRQLLPGFDIYVNSSISEGVSLTILEAMAARLPVVATRVGGTPEVVVHGVTGTLVEARSADALASAILALATMPDRRSTLGDAGRARVEASFTIERMVADYAREYTTLLAGTPIRHYVRRSG